MATRFSGSNDLKQTIIISSATGVLQGFYKKFALHFASLGYNVFTFDYYGIGNSSGETYKLKKNTADLKSWGSIDQAAVVAHAKTEIPENEITLITHSVGGQILGFNPNYGNIDKIILVASQTGFWKYFSGWHYLKMFLLWYVIIPGITPFFGYFPSKTLGLFENLPKKMVYEWAKWGRKKEYLMHFHNEQEYFFDKIKVPILALSFPKDNFAPKATVDWLAAQFKNAKVQREHYIPSKEKLHRLRHFGFFREEFRETLWKKAEQWIQNK